MELTGRRADGSAVAQSTHAQLVQKRNAAGWAAEGHNLSATDFTAAQRLNHGTYYPPSSHQFRAAPAKENLYM